MRAALVLLCVAVVAAGCGSSKKKATPGPPPPATLPMAQTPDQWARRVVDLFLRPLNQDLLVLGNFDNPQVRLYIASRNEQALQTIHGRLGDLRQCTRKLDTIGPPPSGQAAMARVDDRFRNACTSYEDVADRLLEATDLLTSGNNKDIDRGTSLARSAGPGSRAAAQDFVAGVRIAQGLAPFRRAGLKPSV